jgi:outer membrane receptor for ferric coprogen and ferric-rhodotorulic acid
MFQLEDAMRRTTGMLILNNDQGRSSIFTRGYELDTTLVDWLSAPLSSIYGTQLDLAVVDRVEVLRGPAGLFAGTGSPGGIVNLARKRGPEAFSGGAAATVGSWDFYRAEAEIGGPLVESGKVRARLVGAYQDRENFVDVNENQVGVVYGSSEFDLTDSTTLSVGALNQERDILPFNGLPTYTTGELLDLDRSTFIGADWNRFDNRTSEGFVELAHAFDNGATASLGSRYTDRFVDFKYAYAGSAVTPGVDTTNLVAIERKYWEESLALDAHFNQPFKLFGLEQSVLVGADYRRYEQTTLQGSAAAFATVNVFDPTSDVPEPTITLNGQTEVVPEQYGAYGQARLSAWEPLTLVAGGRFTWYDAETHNLLSGSKTSDVEVDNEFTPYVGLVLDVTDNVSAYASYTDIFVPQTQLDASGQPLKPRIGDQYEIGVKADFFDERLSMSLAAFRLRDENRALATAVPNEFVAAGEVEVQGVEAEIGGTVLPGWEIYAGYAYTDTEYLKATAAQQGTAFSTFTPTHNFNLWTKYAFQDGPLEGFHVAGGGRAVSSFYNLSGPTKIKQDGYQVVDLQVGYEIVENVNATLTVNNVFDEEYYTRVGGTSVFNFYGEPRSVWFKLGASF